MVLPLRVGAIVPRLALVLLAERSEDCARLAAEAERAGFEMPGGADFPIARVADDAFVGSALTPAAITRRSAAPTDSCRTADRTGGRDA